MKKRYYSLFWKDGKKWRRIGYGSFPKQMAVRIFQARLLAGSMCGVRTELRPTIALERPADHFIALANTEWLNAMSLTASNLARVVPNNGKPNAGTIQ